jgi:hypothetical protein
MVRLNEKQAQKHDIKKNFNRAWGLNDKARHLDYLVTYWRDTLLSAVPGYEGTAG